MSKNTLEMLSITISGGAFSLLLYENAKIECGQDGFLLGKVEINETKKLTDADHWVLNKETVVKVRSIVPCPEQFHFYDSSGSISKEKIRNFLGHNETDVVGWYIYRPTRSNMKLMLREKIIHKQLAHFFHLPIHHFSCCVLITDWSANKSTHSLSQTFLRYKNGSYEGIPMRIINLSDPMCTYKNGETASDVINNIIKNIKPSKKLAGHLLVQHVQEMLQQKIKDLVLRVSEKEQLLFELENSIKSLNSALQNKKELVVDVAVIDNDLFENSCQYKRVPNDRINKSLNSER